MKNKIKNLPVFKYLFCAYGIFLFFTGIVVLMLSDQNLETVITIILGAMFIICAVFYNRFMKSRKLSQRIFRYVLVLGAGFYIAVSAFLVIYGYVNTPEYTEDVLVVMGCGNTTIENENTVEKRLEKAVEYLKTNPYAQVVVSGGSTSGFLTEADTMAIYLQKNGIPLSRIIKETKSKTTYDRVKQSKRMIESRIGGNYTSVTITSAAQAFRAQLMARRCGMRTQVIGTRSLLWHLPSECMREVLALFRFVIFKY